jgi:hypothetical protein
MPLSGNTTYENDASFLVIRDFSRASRRTTNEDDSHRSSHAAGAWLDRDVR